MVHFRTEDRALLQRWGVTWHYQSGSGTIIAQNDDDIYTLQAWLIPGMGIEDMRPEDVLENWVGKKFDYEILQANPWTANFVVANRYVSGRVALAGDAAHQFVPTGGYGMNSGMADAAGLAWVLAALVGGWGGDRLLEAYEAERKATAWWHLRAAQGHMDVRIQMSGLYAESGDLDGEGPEADAKRAEVGRKIAALGNAENESWGVEHGYRYDDSPIVAHEPNPPEIDRLTYRPSTWPGARMPHIFLADGTPIHDRLGLWFTLVAFGDADVSAMVAAAAEAGIPLDVLRLNRPDLRTIYERDLLLVRPDQHVAWRGDRLPDDVGGLLRLVAGR